MTSIDRPDRHPGAEELLDYFEQKLPEDVERGVEEHLAVCAECAAVGREVHAFHRVWLWPAAAHGKAHLRELLAEAVRRAAAETESASLRRRLEGWGRAWSGLAEAALHVVTEVSADAARALARTLADLARPGSEWSFEAEAVAVPVRGSARSDPASTVMTTALTPGKPRARVAVSAAERGEIVVRLDGVPREQPSPIVLLVAVGGAMTVRVAEARQTAHYRIARFTDVAPGEYLIAFEPLGD